MKRLLALSSTLAFAVALANACGGGDSKKDAGGNDTAGGETGGETSSMDMGGGGDMVAMDMGGGGDKGGGGGACDPVAQDCGMGQKCDMGCMAGDSAPVLKCTAEGSGTGMHGDECGTMKGCAKGLTCLGMGTVYKCQKFCDADTDCPDGKTCGAIKVRCSSGDGGVSDGGVPFDAKACTL